MTLKNYINKFTQSDLFMSVYASWLFFFKVLYFALSVDLQGEYLKAIKKETHSRSVSSII